MPYSISQGGGTCGDSQWAVLAEGGATMGCHGSKGEAQQQLAALYANDADEDSGQTTAADEVPHAPRGRMMGLRHVAAEHTDPHIAIAPPPATRDHRSPHHG